MRARIKEIKPIMDNGVDYFEVEMTLGKVTKEELKQLVNEIKQGEIVV